MAHLQIKSYGLSDTTLEEIFLKVASNIHDGEIVREIQYEDITDHGRLVDHLFFSSLIHKGPSINYVVLEVEGGGQKLPILLCKKSTERGEGVRNHQF